MPDMHVRPERVMLLQERFQCSLVELEVGSAHSQHPFHNVPLEALQNAVMLNAESVHQLGWKSHGKCVKFCQMDECRLNLDNFQ